jgi:hypothetical protein
VLTLTLEPDARGFRPFPESTRVRDRYGRRLYGSSMLVARWLVKAGVPFVSVHQEIFRHYGHSYDMHENNFAMLKDLNLPGRIALSSTVGQQLARRGTAPVRARWPRARRAAAPHVPRPADSSALRHNGVACVATGARPQWT